MEERYLLIIAGAVFIVLNKFFALGLFWWEREVMKFERHYNIWAYGIPCIVMGFLLILISTAKN